MVANAEGEVEAEGRVLVVKRIHVAYSLRLDPDKREVVERVHDFHVGSCPMARTIGNCVSITTSLHIIEEVEESPEAMT